jgi:hypothetical protein
MSDRNSVQTELSHGGPPWEATSCLATHKFPLL